jgi:hypothetical protein
MSKSTRCLRVASIALHVRSWVQTGSDRRTAKVTRLTHNRRKLGNRNSGVQQLSCDQYDVLSFGPSKASFNQR